MCSNNQSSILSEQWFKHEELVGPSLVLHLLD